MCFPFSVLHLAFCNQLPLCMGCHLFISQIRVQPNGEFILNWYQNGNLQLVCVSNDSHVDGLLKLTLWQSHKRAVFRQQAVYFNFKMIKHLAVLILLLGSAAAQAPRRDAEVRVKYFFISLFINCIFYSVATASYFENGSAFSWYLCPKNRSNRRWVFCLSEFK